MEKKFKIKKNKVFSNKMLTKLLNYAAAFIILTIIIMFISRINYFERRNVIYTVRHYNLDNRKISENDKVLIKKSIDSLNTQVNDLKKIKVELEDIQKKNDEEFRFYLAIIGSIISIVGFFGFKSIHDTRQMALEAVKAKAEEVAKKITSDKIGEYVKENVKSEIDSYLDDSGKRYITEVVERIAYDEAERVAKNTTLQEFNRVKTNLEDSRLAFKDDLESIERDRKRLLKRIQDIEKKIYPDPDNEEEEDNSGNDNDSGDDSIKPIV